MSDIVRFGVSIHRSLIEQFDALCERRGYANRSEAIRDLIRDRLVEEEWKGSRGESAATVSLVYDHEILDLPKRLMHVQHENDKMVVATLHVHLDRHNCLEVLILRGQTTKVKALCEQLVSVKGIKHGKYTLTTTGKSLH